MSTPAHEHAHQHEHPATDAAAHLHADGTACECEPTGDAPHDHGAHEHHEHHEHHDHAGHEHAPVSTWSGAAQATLHCLTGCAIGEVLGMVIGTAAGWGNGATIALSIVLAFLIGYALTMRGVLRAGVPFRRALGVALAADTVSIAVMELVDNATMLVIPGALDAGLADWLFWVSLAISLGLAFLVAWPVNRWLIGRGLGHAVVHAYHAH